MDQWVLQLVLLATGFSLGVLGAFFGVGGGFLLTPALNILGLEMLRSVGTSLVYVTGMSGLSLVSHFRRGNVRLVSGVAFGLPAVAGSFLGKRFAETLATLGQAQTVILWCFVTMLLSVAALMLAPGGSGEGVKDRPWFGGLSPGPYLHLGSHRFPLWVIASTGVGIGFLSGLLGVGGGVVVLPLLIHGFGLEPNVAVGTSLVTVILSGAFGGAGYYLAGKVDLAHVAIMLAGAWPGTVLGAKAGAVLGGRRLTSYFAGLVVLAAVGILMKLVGWASGSAVVVFGGLFGLPAFILIQHRRVRLEGRNEA